MTEPTRPDRPIFFLSDFGTRDIYAGVVEAIIAGIAPCTRVIHLTHGIPPQDLRNASWQLWAAAPFLPRGSIVLAVVDPGVGTARRGLVVETERLTFVAPDNGLLEATLTRESIVATHELSDERYRREEVSTTFHGRDVFGPAAAHLSVGVAARAFGPAADELQALGVLPTRGAEGEVWTFDHFGNVITTLAGERDATSVEIAGQSVPHARTYADVERGALVALTGSSGLVEICQRDGSARTRLGLGRDASYSVRSR